MSQEETNARRFVLAGMAFEAGLGVVAWVLGWLVGKPPLESFHWNVRAMAWGGAASIPMLLFFLLLIRVPVGPLARIRDFSENVIRPLFASCSLGELAILSVLAGVGEEMLFRGLLQRALCDWLGFAAGFVAANVLFGLAHLITPTYAVMATLMGMYLGGCWLLADNLLVPIVVHAVYDFFALVYLVKVQLPQAPPSTTA